MCKCIMDHFGDLQIKSVSYLIEDGNKFYTFIAARCYGSAACAVMQCPSVCPSVTFVDYVVTNKNIFKFFHHWLSTQFYFFCTKRHDNIPIGTP